MIIRPPVKINPVVVNSPVSLTDPDPVAGAIVYDRSLWFEGEGAPPSPDTIGAKDGDCYLDTLTGNVYRLEV
jgi:hypothetical protein